MHHACPLTTALCTAAATAVPGTLPFEAAPHRPGIPVAVAHPKGVIDVEVSAGLHSVSVLRTARRLLTGTANPSRSLS
jgi:2-methylaconitate cis-trans-isomerase PrpF